MSEAILATFADVKFIRTRSTMQLVLELPIEQADEALKALGGVPQPGTERWVGVALAPKERKELGRDNAAAAASSKPHGEPKVSDKASVHRPFNSLPLSQQAGIRCNDQQFQDFLLLSGRFCIEDDESDSASEAALAVRNYCGITSRSELDTNEIAAAKWKKLEADYQAYLTDLRYAGSPGL